MCLCKMGWGGGEGVSRKGPKLLSLRDGVGVGVGLYVGCGGKLGALSGGRGYYCIAPGRVSDTMDHVVVTHPRLRPQTFLVNAAQVTIVYG